MRTLSWYKGNPEYQENIASYTPADGCFALALYAAFLLVCYGLAVFASRFLYIRENILFFGALAYWCMIGITYLLMRLRKQGLSSVGLVGGRWILSCLMGIVVAVISFMGNGGFTMIQSHPIISIKEIAHLILYFLTIALCEELVFRGFIGTRINGLIKKRWIAIVTISVFFAFSHLLIRAAALNISILDLLFEQWMWLAELFVLHIIWNFIYLKTNSLAGPILSHWAINLAFEVFAG